MPDDFVRRWLSFDAQRPARYRLARRFLAAFLAMLAFTALLAFVTGR